MEHARIRRRPFEKLRVRRRGGGARRAARVLTKKLALAIAGARVFGIAMLWCLLFTGGAAAQLTRGTISGIVRDASEAVVPGAAVTITNVDTNAVRAETTDARGFFTVGALEPGRYRARVELAGFSPAEQTDLLVRAASELSLAIVIAPARVGESVDVSAHASELNKVNPTIGFTTSARTVVELPLAGDRNVNGLIATLPNALVTSGQGTYAINGQRPRNNNYMIDGADNNDIAVTIPTSQIVPEAIAEFQVLQNPYTAEFGRNTGGQINIITKSGTNRFRGEAWDYFFDSSFRSLSSLEKASGRTKPSKFSRHQLGGHLGGPIVRDRLFFFGLYQRDAQRPEDRPFGTSVRIPTPEGLAALQQVPLGAGQTMASRQAVLDRLAFLRDIHAQNVVFQNPATTMVNGVAIPTGAVNVGITDPSTYHSLLGRVDYQAGRRDLLTARYSLNNRQDTNSISNCAFGARFCGSQDLVDTNVAASHAHIFTPRVVNELRVSLVRRDLDFPENDPVSPTAAITGLFTIGGATNYPQSRLTNAAQFADTLTWARGRHTIKAGADIRYNRAEDVSAFDSKGTFTFDSLQDYINNRAFQFRQAQQIASWRATQWQTFLFVQDDVRPIETLTLNVGLRYERSQVPLGLFGATDADSLAALVPAPVVPEANWAPRVGFAWSPRAKHALLGDGRTVIRGGVGVGYDVLFYNLLTVTGSNFPRVQVANQFDARNVYPAVATPGSGGTARFDPLATYTNAAADTRNPRSRFYSLTLQRELGNYLVEAGYSGSRGSRGINQIDANPAILTPDQAALVAAARDAGAIPGVQARRLSPQLGTRTLIPATLGPGGNDVEARSRYHALFVSANRRLADGLQLRSSYTWSRWESNNDAALGEGGADASSQRPQNSFDYAAEWSRSQFDRPHRFVASYIWEVPGPSPARGWLGLLAGGWQMTGITQFQSGRPFTITTGVDSNGDGSTGSDRPDINPAGSLVWDRQHASFTNNGYYIVPLGTNDLPLANSLGHGNAPRNSERAAGAWNTDLSFMKRFPLPFVSTKLLARVDCFNILGQRTYGVPNLNMSSPSFGQNTNDWGRRTVTFSGKLAW